MRRFAAWLKTTRNMFGLSSTSLAHKTGIHSNTLSKYETAERSPSRANAIKLARALGVNPDEALAALMADSPDLMEQYEEEAYNLYRDPYRDPDLTEIIAGYHTLNTTDRQLIKSLVNRLADTEKQKTINPHSKT